MLEKITRISMRYPKSTIAVFLLITAIFLVQFPKMKIDTDPENMLQHDQPDRAYYDQVKEEFGIDDIIMIGLVDEKGIFKPETLDKVDTIIDEIKKIDLTYNVTNEDGEEVTMPAINTSDIVSLTTTKNLYSSGDGIDPRYVMPVGHFSDPVNETEFQNQLASLQDYIDAKGAKVPSNSDELLQLKASKIHDEILDTPFLNGRIASEDGTAIGIYIPITTKKMGYPVAQAVTKIVEDNKWEGLDFHVAGLPIAEETFGHEMFVQMAVVAPAAFILIMLIVYLLFKQPMFLVPVGVTSVLAVIWAMGLLIGLDFTVHIMSSMIPVFLLPIAILNTVHILSQFFDRFTATRNKEESLLWAMKRLYVPMFFTSLTSAVGFASLAMADIPPVQVFGVFVSFGIAVAWFFSVSLVPAMVNLLNEAKLAKNIKGGKEAKKSWLDKILHPIGSLSYKNAGMVLIGAAIALVIGIVGILQIEVNDNPVKWFKKGHPIRVADEVLNEKFGGTYMTNIILEGAKPPKDDDKYKEMLETAEFPNMLNKPEVAKYISEMQTYLESHEIIGKASSTYDAAKRVRYVFIGANEPEMSKEEKFDNLYSIAQPHDFSEQNFVKKQLFEEQVIDEMSDEEYDEFFDKYEFIEDSPEFKNFTFSEEEKQEVMAAQMPILNKRSYDFLNWSIAQLDNDKATQNDLTKFLVREQRVLGEEGAGEIENVWKKANIWIQLKSGDNQKMQQVEQLLATYLNENPLPEGVKVKWTGLTYVNKVWQDLMVNGMLFAIIGSFAIVFVLMLIEFRSLTLGILSMIPLTLALILSYGLMGWIGKDYDMPIAVCSSLSLGLAVDFAIHFLQRYKNHYKETGMVEETHNHMFEEPGRAILRNAFVISLGFLPLMISSLTPYVTVGSFFSLLMVMATMATIFVLPASMKFLAERVLKKGAKA